MEQLFFIRKGKLEWRDVPAPFLTGGADALVRPIAAARCDLDEAYLFQNLNFKLMLGNMLGLTDPSIPRIFGKRFFQGPFPFGHECVGEIIETGEHVKNFRKGDLVIVPFQISCGLCASCLRGTTAVCESTPQLSMYGFGKHLQFGGAVADLLKVPYADSMLLKVEGDSGYAHFASLADNVPDAYSRVAPFLMKDPETTILVLSGRAKSVGLYAVLIAKALGCKQIGYVDKDAGRRDVARKAGADELFESFSEIGSKYKLLVDACAGEQSIHSGIKFLQSNGVISSTGIYLKKTSLPLVEMYSRGCTFNTGLANARPDGEKCLELIGKGLDLGIITSSLHNWEDAEEAFLVPGTKVIVSRERITQS